RCCALSELGRGGCLRCPRALPWAGFWRPFRPESRTLPQPEGLKQASPGQRPGETGNPISSASALKGRKSLPTKPSPARGARGWVWEMLPTPCCSCRSVRSGHYFLQGGRVDRLGQVLVKAGLTGPAAVLVAAVASDGNHASPGRDRVPPQVLRDVVAIHP